MEDNLRSVFNKAQRGLVPSVETFWSLVIADGGTYQYPNHVVMYVTRAGSCEHFLFRIWVPFILCLRLHCV